MKQYILLLLILLGISNHINAQFTDVRNRLLWGAKAGVNYSNVYDPTGEAFISKPKFGLATGIFLAIPIGKYLGIQPEVFFSQKGFKATGMIFGQSYNVTRTTNYIDIPLLFAFKPSEFLSLYIGPQYSYLLKKRNVFLNATTSIAQERAFENENIRKNTFGFTTGLDISIQHILIGGRVAWDFQHNTIDGSPVTPRYKNICYQVTIGYRFYNN